jgi:alpha-tubulin suppressor-like RCC1 family protein
VKGGVLSIFLFPPGSTGAVFAFGYNSKGQLGVSDSVDRLTPVLVLNAFSTVSAVAVNAGSDFSLVVSKMILGVSWEQCFVVHQGLASFRRGCF